MTGPPAPGRHSFSSVTCALNGVEGRAGVRSEVRYAQASSGTVAIAASHSGDQNNLASSASVTLDVAWAGGAGLAYQGAVVWNSSSGLSPSPRR